MTGPHLEMEGLLDVPPGAEVLKDSSVNAGSIALTTQKKRHGLQTTRTKSKQVPVDNSWTEILGSGSSASSYALDRQVTTNEDGPPMSKHELLNQLRTEW